jgi:anaerobic magnesium-protoporphyrin IX monomethyl ester cyclase
LFIRRLSHLSDRSGSFSSSNSSKKEILLVYPGKYREPTPQIPLSLLHVASPLYREGYDVRIFDMRVENYRDFDIGEPIFVGLSCMSGQQIRYAMLFAQKVRKQNPLIPIVWGGVHPTLLPEQTAVSDLVDVVVRGEAELQIVELARKLADRQPLKNVPGITYKVEGAIKNNPDADVIELNNIPAELPYDLLHLSKYPSIRSGRFHLQTSRGCPHQCGFCYNIIFNKQRWRGKSATRVLDEIEYIIQRFPNVKIIDPIDDNFFVDRKRVEDICQGIINRKIEISWRANCRFDYLSSYSKPFLSLLEKSGCVELDFGGESGSTRLQQLIQKDVTAQQMLQSVEKLRKWTPKIKPYTSWMCGLPTETDEDLQATFDLIDRMSEANPKTQHYGIFIYTPFPSPVLEQLPPSFKKPQSLEEWSNIEAFHFKPPWHTKKQVEKLHTVFAVTRYAFYPSERIRERNWSFRLAYGALCKVARYRWRHKYFGFPIELKAVDAVVRRFKGYL